jgi:nitroreductase
VPRRIAVEAEAVAIGSTFRGARQEVENVTVEDPWKTSEEDFPRSGQAEERLHFLLNYAVLAPSGHNTQPWLFKVSHGVVELHADRTRCLPVVDPEDRALVISCGAALFFLRVAIRHFGQADEVRTFPNPDDPDLLAEVRLGAPYEATAEEHQLFEAIRERRTNRSPFQEREIPQEVLDALEAAAREEGAWLRIVQDGATKNAVADLVAEGDRAQWSDRRFRRELAAWMHPNRTRSRDGMPGYAFGFGEIMSLAGPLVMRTFDMGAGRAAQDRQLAEGSPVLAVLGTETDTPIEWLSAGQALGRVLLRARAEGVYASYLNQPIEVPELRPRLRDVVGASGLPQLLLRMGYGPGVRLTPRRPVTEV